MSDVMLCQGDALRLPLRDACVQMICTSVPYWQQRSYLDANDPLKVHELGREATVDEYLANMVTVFREVFRVLRPDGTLWCNVGDKMVNKQLIGLPWKFAFALQDDGWILRSEVIWHKVNCLPEPVRDRPTRSHEQVFLLSKSPRYFFDNDAIKEDAAGPGKPCGPKLDRSHNGAEQRQIVRGNGLTRQARSVWSFASEGFSGAHFATMPTALASRCILAGSSTRCCPQCHTPYQRQMERTVTPDPSHRGSRFDVGKTGVNGNGRVQAGERFLSQTTGFIPGCSCVAQALAEGCRDPQQLDWLTTPVPSLVLDCFSGSATVPLTARALGRHGIGIELSWDYLMLSRERLGLEALDTWLGKPSKHHAADLSGLPLFAATAEEPRA